MKFVHFPIEKLINAFVIDRYAEINNQQNREIIGLGRSEFMPVKIASSYLYGKYPCKMKLIIEAVSLG
ncbi:MAG: hypothetical protein ACP5F1_06850 [Thermoplasmata archaeon]